MSNANPNPAASNEFGTVVQTVGVGDNELNQQGKEVSLADILAEIRGKNLEKPAVEARTIDTTPGVQAKIGDEPAAAVDIDPLGGTGEPVNTGNRALDVAVNSFIKSTGASDADIQRACKNAIEYGDPALIDDAFLKERFKEKADDARAIVEAVLEQAQIEKTKLIDAVHTAAGGEAQWAESLAAYKQHAPAGLQKALKLMFESGDAGSVKEAAAMVVEFAKGSGVLTSAGTRQVAGSGTQDSQGLSKAEFQQAMSKLNTSSRTYTADYNRLIEMRRVGSSLGK